MGQTILVTSAARTATKTSDTVVKSQEVAASFILSITAAPGGDTVTMKVQGLTLDGDAYDILVGSAQVATGITAIHVGRGVTTTANVSAGLPLPDQYRVVITHSGAGSFTYEVEVNTSR